MTQLWRIVSASAAVLAAFTLLASVWLFSEIQDQRVAVIRALCQGNNEQNRVLDQLLAASTRERVREGRPLTPNGRRALRRARRALRPIPCEGLPVEQPVPWK